MFVWQNLNFKFVRDLIFTQTTSACYDNYTWLNFHVFFTFVKMKSQQTFPVIHGTIVINTLLLLTRFWFVCVYLMQLHDMSLIFLPILRYNMLQ